MDQTPASCPRCKASVPAEASACPACGEPLTGATSEPTLLRTQMRSPVSAATQPQPDRVVANSPQLGIAVGRRFGHYEVVKPIARGGMGMVFLAKDLKLDRQVALKVLLAGDLAAAEEVKRFQREAMAAGRLRHPNIVPIHDVGEQDGWCYLAMELVDGKPLSEVLRERRLSPEEAAELIAEVADGIAHAHKNGVIHRDLKPANLLVDTEGNVRITDFGLAKIAKGADLTESGTTLGTPNFMPPEQALGEVSQIDERSDVYSLGAILFDLLTGRPPFAGDSAMATLLKVIQGTPPSPRSLNPKIPAELEAICMKALEKEKPRRYASAKELADALRGFRTRSPQKEAPQVLRVRRRHHRRRGKKWVSLLCVFLAVAAIIAAQFLPEKKAVPQKPPVEAEGGRWELKQQETFTAGFPKDWEIKGWTIQKGVLEGDDGATATLRTPMPECAAIEMDLALGSGQPGTFSINFEEGDADVASVTLKPRQESLVLVGEWDPQASLSSEGVKRTAELPAAGSSAHTLRVERTGLSLRGAWDKPWSPQLIVPYAGPFSTPVRISISLSGGNATLHQLRLFGASPFYRGSAFRVAEWLQKKGMFEGAERAYKVFLSEHPEGSLSEEAKAGIEECARLEGLNGGPQEGEKQPDAPLPGLLPTDPMRRPLLERLAQPPTEQGAAWDAYLRAETAFGKGQFEQAIKGCAEFLRLLAPQERGARIDEATDREFADMLLAGEQAADLDSSLGSNKVVQWETMRERMHWWRPVVSHLAVLDLKALAFGEKYTEARTQLTEALDLAPAGSDARGRLRLVECQIARLQGKPDEALSALDEVLGDKGWVGGEAECLSAETRILKGDFEGAASSAAHARLLRTDARLAMLEAVARLLLKDAPGAKKSWEQAVHSAGAEAATPLWKGVGEMVAGDTEAAKKDLKAARDGALGKEPPYELADFLLKAAK